MRISDVLTEMTEHVRAKYRNAPHMSHMCGENAQTVFRFLTGLPVPDDQGLLMDEDVDRLPVSGEVPRRVTYVDLTGSGMGSGHRFCILGWQCSAYGVPAGPLTLRFDNRALYAVLEANNGEELPTRHALGDAPVRVMVEAEFTLWWQKLRAVVANNGDVGPFLGARKPIQVQRLQCTTCTAGVLARFLPE